MGAADSKAQISPPQTPVYLKYSHLQELQDPRSPLPCTEGSRTPILSLEGKGITDPRSPTTVVPRTPIFCIPEPKEEEAVPEITEDSTERLSEQAKAEGKDEENPPEVSDGPNQQVENPKTEVAVVESSPETMANQVEFTDKGYLIKKNKNNSKKRRRRRKNKTTNNNENEVQGVVTKNLKKEKSFALENQVPRSPLAARRNIMRREAPESPSLEYLVKNTRRLSLTKSNPKAMNFDYENIAHMGKENMAATFSP